MKEKATEHILSQPPLGQGRPRLECIQTTLGFDLLLDPGDFLGKLLIRDRTFEAPETDLVSRLLRLGDTCIDAGCHMGYYTCLMARLVGPAGHVYAFDANPKSCESTQRNLALNGLRGAEVIHAALGDRRGSTPFHISTDDQTGLSSLGPITPCRETITVPWVRLEEFLKERRVRAVRLLKLDVEGAEEIVLKGVERFLRNHLVDYVLVECYDERLQLLNSSTQQVAGVLHSAGYQCWEYGAVLPSGWAKTSQVTSRGDCNYFFAAPTVQQTPPILSLSQALAWTREQRNELQGERDQLRRESASLKQETVQLRRESASLTEEAVELRAKLEKSENDIDWLTDALTTRAQEVARLRQGKETLEDTLKRVENSAGWRFLNRLRRLRDALAPAGTRRRKIYETALRPFRSPSSHTS